MPVTLLCVCVLQFLDFNVVSEPRIMLPDGSVRVSNDCDVTPVMPPEPSSSRKSIGWKGKSRASAPPLVTDVKLKPKLYMGFLLRFVHRQLYIRNTKDTIVEDYNVPQVMTRRHTYTTVMIVKVKVNMDLYSASS